MMRCFIRIVDGQPFEHPIAEENFLSVFPDIDINNLPDWMKEFVRNDPPILGPFDKRITSHSYKFVDGKYTDFYEVEKMSEEEKQLKITSTMQSKPFAAWIFNEELCIWEPPIAYPSDGKKYVWSNTASNWIEYNLDVSGDAPDVIG